MKPSPDATPEQKIILAGLLKKSRRAFPALNTNQVPPFQDYSPELAHLQAQTGAAYMDVYCPGWVQTTDLGRLNLAMANTCMLGQQAHCLTKGKVKSFSHLSYEGCLRLITKGVKPYSWELWAVRRGFTVPVSIHPIPERLQTTPYIRMMFEMLTIAWKEQIRKRLVEV